MVLGYSGGGWVQRLGFFARLYSLVCICLSVFVCLWRCVRPLLRSPTVTVWVPPGERREPLHFQSIRAIPLCPRYKLYAAESTAYSQETAREANAARHLLGMQKPPPERYQNTAPTGVPYTKTVY